MSSSRLASMSRFASRVANSQTFRTQVRRQGIAAFSTSEKPFNKVLIANRGEIAQRVMRTCNRLGIPTVAIYSSIDAKAPFVQQADEAVWIGPPPANQSYLQVPRVLEAIELVGADAVHPGYGFLSENANFANSITEKGAKWLGPPTYAIQELGDKVRSKQIASEAGVNIIPGYDGEIESVEHAKSVANNEIGGYPVLIKAAAGGGGKGMRICFNDQDLEDAYDLAKSEALNYFADDRLLVEKYIVNPHHIEFQVLGVPPENPGDEMEVVVFAERECSIQRRNQKIVEESPSCLLTPETRAKMQAQTQELVRKVGYESAGTVEWLVDEEENFYFLEMNTRLQVEHPVTELVSHNVDLVQAMLWIGAGWGLPDEFKPHLEEVSPNYYVMNHKGHAMECRIYAEDPLRGFLPSTGPLLPYVEPDDRKDTPGNLRLDSGVMQGHVVTPYYDPILTKICYHADTRQETIDGLATALDRYVIEGVRHNAKLCNAVLRNTEFQEGKTPTSFLGKHYPEGFKGVMLEETQKEELAVAVLGIFKERSCLTQIPPLAATSSKDDNVFIVKLGGQFGEAYKVTADGATSMTVQKLSAEGEPGEAKTISLDTVEYEPRNYIANVSVNGVPRYLQVVAEKPTGELKVQMYGADMEALVQSPREFELSQIMHEPVLADTSSMVLSPMPGTLVSFAVEAGEEVEIGQELCIVEAMKMQNIIRSPRHGVIGELKVEQGAALRADQVILNFAEEEQKAA